MKIKYSVKEGPYCQPKVGDYIKLKSTQQIKKWLGLRNGVQKCGLNWKENIC